MTNKDIEKQVAEQPVMGYKKVALLGSLHLNGNVICAVDTETTGLIAGFHDIIQICVLPLNSVLEPMKEVIPFYCDIKPKRIENCDPESTKVNRGLLTHAAINGIDPDRAADLLDEWVQKLKLAPDKRISPLASNWPHDRDFIRDWIGRETMTQFFDGRYRDTQAAALFLNDLADWKTEQIPFPRVGLRSLCTKLKVEHEFAHDALQDCLATANCYRKMLKL
jgi:DNA polymerase III epsilon subunit-like protein